MWRRLLGLLLGGLLLAAAQPVRAHKSSDAYLFIDASGSQTTLRWDIALRDLDAALPQLDADGNRELTWGEVRAAWPAIDAFAKASLQVGHCRFEISEHALEQRSDGAYAVLLGQAACKLGEASPIGYRLFADIDPTHRGILKLTLPDGRSVARLLDPGAAVSAFQAGPATAAPESFVEEGVHHILTGWDHLLFLLCLLLPAVLHRDSAAVPPTWQAVSGWRGALWPVVRTVTLFTLAHSLTLALAALGYVTLPSRIVEPAIAVTIVLAAMDNIRPLVGAQRRGFITFAFGLIHGFGFAGVLAELQLPAAEFGWALLRFNLGLELGQLAVVAAVVPALYLLRHQRLYVPAVMRAGSAAAAMLATVWLVERTADISLLPF